MNGYKIAIKNLKDSSENRLSLFFLCLPPQSTLLQQGYSIRFVGGGFKKRENYGTEKNN